MKRTLFTLLLMLLVSASFAQVSAIPQLMNFQGRLARPDGTPVANGTYSVRFSLHSALSGGTEVWNQTVGSVMVKNGTFSVQLSGFPAGTFHSNPWLEIKIGTNAPLTPRQPLVTVPYAFKADMALTVPDGSITNAKIANGTITANKFAANIFNPLAWLLGGNSGVTSGFMGTTDIQPLTFKVNNRRAMQYQYAENTANAGSEYRSVNLLGGSELNVIAAGVVGATIAGGGADNFTGMDYPNRVMADFGTIGGGYGNTADDRGATISGGWFNTASGPQATIGGGFENTASSAFVTVGGGWHNTASREYAMVGGGFENTANNYTATVSGGGLNTASGNDATVGGGFNNAASGAGATVGGGGSNTASGAVSTVPGGLNNTAAGHYSLAAGRSAAAYHNGTFAWADDADVEFASTAPNQFLIRASGGIGINTNAPNSHLALQGSVANARFQIGGTGGDANHLSSGRDFVFNATGGLFTFRSISNINNLDSYTDQFVIQSNGNANLRGLLFQFSDRRYKTHVSTFSDALDAILNLRGVTYEWDRAHWPEREYARGRQIGFIAQEVERILPELVTTDSNGYKSVAYANVVPVLVEAVKTLKTRQEGEIHALKQENAELRRELQAVLKRLERLEAHP